MVPIDRHFFIVVTRLGVLLALGLGAWAGVVIVMRQLLE